MNIKRIKDKELEKKFFFVTNLVMQILQDYYQNIL